MACRREARIAWEGGTVCGEKNKGEWDAAEQEGKKWYKVNENGMGSEKREKKEEKGRQHEQGEL